MKNSKSKIAAISLFSGCGGLDLGCQMAGVPVISCLDFEKDCIDTLRLNHQLAGAELFLGDIATIPSAKFKKVLATQSPEKFIIIGGPPCQPFSKAGYWIGNHRRKKHKDPRNMIAQFFRVVRDLKPDGFLLENVESILHPTNKSAVEEIYREIKRLRYHFKLIRANSLDYGVPQKRKRVFFICSKKPFKTEEPIKTHYPPDQANKLGRLPYESVRKFISKFDHPKYFEPQEITIKGTYGDVLEKIPPGENYFAVTASRGYKSPQFVAGKRFWSFLLKLHPEQPSWTIAAQPGPWVGPFHWKNRRLRVPEIAAIQTFPFGYKFSGSRRSIQKQIGNAVPPLLGKAMVSFLVGNL